MNYYLNAFKSVLFAVLLILAMTACGQKGDLYLPNIPPAPNVLLEQSGPMPTYDDSQDQLNKVDAEKVDAEDEETESTKILKGDNAPDSDSGNTKTVAE